MTATEYAAIRRSIGLSQPQLAKRLGVHPMTVSRRERGVRAITREAEIALLALVETVPVGEGTA